MGASGGKPEIPDDLVPFDEVFDKVKDTKELVEFKKAFEIHAKKVLLLIKMLMLKLINKMPLNPVTKKKNPFLQ